MGKVTAEDIRKAIFGGIGYGPETLKKLMDSWK